MEVMIDHNPDYTALEELIKYRTCVNCDAQLEIASIRGSFAIVCFCPGGPEISSRETQVRYIERKKQKLAAVTKPEMVPCPDCEGEGFCAVVPGRGSEGYEKCERCGGAGEVPRVLSAKEMKQVNEDLFGKGG